MVHSGHFTLKQRPARESMFVYRPLWSPHTKHKHNKRTRYTICLCPNSSILGHLLWLACVPSDFWSPARLGCKHGVSCSVLQADDRLLSHSFANLMEGPDLSGSVSFWRLFLPSAGSEERLDCTVFLYGSKTIIINISTKTKAKQKQSLSHPARKELKPRQIEVKNLSQMHPYGNY